MPFNEQKEQKFCSLVEEPAQGPLFNEIPSLFRISLLWLLVSEAGTRCQAPMITKRSTPDCHPSEGIAKKKETKSTVD
jgi:hypothetical protein